MTEKFYSGIGSRTTPEDVCDEMTLIAAILNECGYTLRSGAADRADSAFEAGAGDDKEIYLPWDGFNNRRDGIVMGNSFAARKIAMQFHPYWDNLTQGGKALHTRNVPQVLGRDLKTPSEFVVCWTPDGKASGGTGTAMEIAMSRGIEVINLKNTKFPLDRFL